MYLPTYINTDYVWWEDQGDLYFKYVKSKFIHINIFF